MQINLFEILTYFIIYSFLGWIMESIVRSFAERKIINTGFLIGPFCPIYGFGACIMFLFLSNLKNRIILLFFVSVIILSVWEYVVGIFLEKAFHTKYWDYSDHKINFQGRICLTNSICWGVIGVLFVHFIHPFIQGLVGMIDIELLHYVIGIITIVFLTDTIVSIIKVKNIKGKLEHIEKINKEIKEKLKEIKALSKEKDEDKKTAAENIQLLVDKLNNKKNRTILHLYRNVYRLKKAFPAINTSEITEVLSQKIELRKNKKKKQAKNSKTLEK